MIPPLRICFAASELAPFAKTGGLADVAGALCRELARRGHDVRPFLPLHGSIDRQSAGLRRVDFAQDVEVWLGPRRIVFSLWTGSLPDGGPAVYFVDCPELFHRPTLYTDDPDEPVRFALFCRAVLESCQRMGFAPQIVHANDWHTALLPLLLRTVYDWDALFRPHRTVMTIHNIGYQGVFAASTLEALGLAAWQHLFDPEELKAGRVNLLRTGLLYASVVTTVSPTYAREIQTPEYGMGLHGLLRARRETLVGILNGVDYAVWSPERDPFLPHRFSAKRLEGKERIKLHLLRELGLELRRGAPLAGIVSRLTPQKGFDLCTPVLAEVLATSDLGLVALGSGEARYEEFFAWLEQRFPGKVCFYRGHHEELAHLIEAGADLFLMPSRYEPSGLNQMYSLRYGTIPIVRRTGGLADSVAPWNPATGEGTGFVFDHFTPEGLRWALGAALETWRDRRAWRRLQANAMAEDFSWERQADRYEELYRWLVKR